MADYISAHKFSSNHRKELENDTVCGCFYCLKIFDPKEITEWIEDTSGTAICPYCGVDSVIGSYTGYPITKEFLETMYQYWFREVPITKLSENNGGNHHAENHNHSC